MSDWAAEGVTRGDVWMLFLWWQVTVWTSRPADIEFPREMRIDTGLHTILAQIRDILSKK